MLNPNISYWNLKSLVFVSVKIQFLIVFIVHISHSWPLRSWPYWKLNTSNT